MANQYKIIDESKWERAMHCMVFANLYTIYLLRQADDADIIEDKYRSDEDNGEES